MRSPRELLHKVRKDLFLIINHVSGTHARLCEHVYILWLDAFAALAPSHHSLYPLATVSAVF